MHMMLVVLFEQLYADVISTEYKNKTFNLSNSCGNTHANNHYRFRIEPVDYTVRISKTRRIFESHRSRHN